MTGRGLIAIRRTDRATLFCVAALAILPVVMFSINRSYLYTLPGTLDPWVYAGYHVHFRAMWHFSAWGYYGTRVPYTALGYVLYRIFGTEPSLFALAGLQFYVATFSLFYTIRTLFKSPVAGFVAACVLGTNSSFLWAIGWKYVDGPSIACMLFSFAALTAATHEKPWRLAVLTWGASMAATTALYPMFVVLLPVEIVAFGVLNWYGSRRPVLPVTLLLTAGFIANILLMGVVNWGLGGIFNYFKPTIDVLGEVGSPAEAAAYYAPWHFWIWSASWLLFPAFAYISSWIIVATRAPTLLRSSQGETAKENSSEAGIVALSVACILAVSGFAFMQLRHFNVLQIFYHENIMWPFAFLVFGGCFAYGLSRVQSGRALLAIGVAGALLCFTPWVLAAFGYIRLPLPNDPIVGAPPSSLLLPAIHIFSGNVVESLWVVAGAALLLGSIISRRWVFSLAATLFLSVISIAIIPPNSNVDAGPLKPDERNGPLMIYDMAQFIDDSRGTNPIAFWWDKNDARKQGIYYSLGEMYIWNPFIAPVITADERVVILASDGRLKDVEHSLAVSMGLKILSAKTKHFQRGNLAIDVAIADIALTSRGTRPSVPPSRSLSAASGTVTIPLQEFIPGAPRGPVLIRTPKGPWQYAAEARIPDALARLHPATASLHLRFRVNSGIIGIGATTIDGSTFLARNFYRPTPYPRDASIVIPRFSDASQIVICNGDSAASSSVMLYSVDLEYK